MKLKITEIEATAEELRQSNSIADGLTRLLRNAFSPYYFAEHIEDDDDDETEKGEAYEKQVNRRQEVSEGDNTHGRD